MKLIACDPVMGLPRFPYENFTPDKADLLAEMQRLGIHSAIVRHRLACENGPISGNAAIMDDLRGEERLLPTWYVTPDGLEPDYDPAKMMDDMRRAGVRVCWADPVAEAFSPLPWCSGPLYELLQQRQVPLLLSYDAIKPDDLDTVLNAFPRLCVILLNVPRTGRHRIAYALLRCHPSLMLCLSHTYSAHHGFEDLYKTFGQERWVFGMGYPEAEGGAAITGLSYADLPVEAKEAIAHGNIERLLAEVR